MKSLFVALSLCVCLMMACNPVPTQPQAEVGWGGNDQMVKITDSNGEQFLIKYLLYQQLFASGGANKVIHYYHSHPEGMGLHRSTIGFRASRSLQDFGANYKKMNAKKLFYVSKTPYTSRVRRSDPIRRAYKYFSSKSSKRTLSSSFRYSSPSRSFYRSSFRSGRRR